MLAIRMQRTGRKGHAMFRMIVQDSRRTPTSGKVVAQLGSYDPHTKSLTLDKEKAGFYLEHGAQPTGRAVLLLKKEGVKLPKWVQTPDKQEGKVRNPDKRRSTRPDEPEAAEADQPTEQKPAETPADDTPAEEASNETPAEEAAVKAEEVAAKEDTKEEPSAPDEAETKAKNEQKPAEEPADEASNEADAGKEKN